MTATSVDHADTGAGRRGAPAAATKAESTKTGRPSGAAGTRVLVRLLDDLADAPPPADRSTAYHNGYTAGIRFARICVLDEIALASGSFAKSSHTRGRRRDRERVRAGVALGTIAARLSRDAVPGAEDDAAGRRDAISLALRLISEYEREINQETGGV
ncbi:hypothetical protein [Mycobacterium sp. IS-3022]|uniref:hypothetical protein n=1 Tax=Mycobacterium sp. IS-3022 TaxID=1772277 RepID=UPI000741635C|nr:hypothetical protein [Mycobacterium sp. IS-3022]KUH97286.1 hypothetical protein AU188_21505 [Mycobacterium sp. IS-3022]KUH97397.1 hypothetical protein AU188_22180 [Mycobacterium sp. IS-3022]